jgi:cell division protein FtsL
MMEIPIGYILTALTTLATALVALAGVVYKTQQEWRANLKERIDVQDKRLEKQDKVIDQLHAEVDHMRKGCGQAGCHWLDFKSRD